MSPHVLVVDDEPALLDAVGYALRGEGYEVTAVADGETAIATAAREHPDVVLLDVMLPGISGLEVCRRLREESDVPIMMLTARDGEVDHVIGLESGADDYVTKPFSMAELVSRVRAMLRRRALDRRRSSDETVVIGGLTLDPMRHRVSVDGVDVDLTPSEFKVLALLAREPGRVFSRREIMQDLWESRYVGDQRACDIHVSNLRHKIERDPQRPERLLTIRGVGYKLAEV
jgi:two-component system response regulator RegX3